MGYPAKKNKPSNRKIIEVSLSLDGERIIVLFENGEGVSISRKMIPGDDGTPVIALQIFDHQQAFLVKQASGAVYDLPSDSARHYALGGKQKKIALGPKIKSLRNKLGLTQEELAKKISLTRVQLSRVETEQSQPGLETLLSLCRVFNINPSTLEKS